MPSTREDIERRLIASVRREISVGDSAITRDTTFAVDLLERADNAGDIIARRIREDEQGDRMEGDRFE